MSNQQVQTKGIYHGLPVYPESLNGQAAIITGANGISGYYMYRVLAQSPKLWKKIYCLSRRPPLIPGGLPDHVEHIPLDFLKEPNDIAAVLKEKGVKADYVFFFSYIQVEPKPGKGLWSDADEMARVNALLVRNFLEAMKIAEVKPKRFMLQTGFVPTTTCHCRRCIECTLTQPQSQELRRPHGPNKAAARRIRPSSHIRSKLLLPARRPGMGVLQNHRSWLEHLHARSHSRSRAGRGNERSLSIGSLLRRQQETRPETRFPRR